MARPEERKFLQGLASRMTGSEQRIAPKGPRHIQGGADPRNDKPDTGDLSLSQIVEELTPYLVGWSSYFGFCQTPRVLTNLEAWIRRGLRSYLWRQWGNRHNRFKELRRRGVPQFRAAVAASLPQTGFWRMSGTPNSPISPAQPPLRVAWSPDSYVPARLNPIEPPWYVTHMPGATCGRGNAVEASPIPINERSLQHGTTGHGSFLAILHSIPSCRMPLKGTRFMNGLPH